MTNNKKHNVKYNRRLVFKLALIMMSVIFLAFTVTAGVFYILEKYNLITYDVNIPIVNKAKPHPFTGLILLLCTGVLAGTVIGICISRRFIKPISSLGKAMNEVAQGEFDIHIKGGNEKTELGNLIINFNKMVDGLKQIETLQTDFIVNVSHEFKTPLSTISGYSMLLQDSDLTKQERDAYVSNILSATQRLSSLTTNILKLSKIENNTFTIDKKPYNLAEQIRQNVLLYEKEWNEKELNLEIELPETCIFNGDDELFSGVWNNLIGNAIKFTDNSGTIRIHLQENAQEITVVIQDTGIGIPPEKLSRIFEKFYQGDLSRSKEGNGLGLALVKKIIDTTGNKIFVESTENVGSKFTVVLYKE